MSGTISTVRAESMSTYNDLIAALKADVEPGELWLVLGSQWNIDRAQEAARGDLRSVQQLHHALLPGWYCRSTTQGSAYISDYARKLYEYQSGSQEPADQARAWLICILMALAAQEGS
jgi:hypothetical protein